MSASLCLPKQTVSFVLKAQASVVTLTLKTAWSIYGCKKNLIFILFSIILGLEGVMLKILSVIRIQ